MDAESRLNMVQACKGRCKPPAENWEGAGGALCAYLLLITKAAMRMTTRTTLPETETSRTVELAPSPMIREGTGRTMTWGHIGAMLRGGTC